MHYYSPYYHMLLLLTFAVWPQVWQMCGAGVAQVSHTLDQCHDVCVRLR